MTAAAVTTGESAVMPAAKMTAVSVMAAVIAGVVAVLLCHPAHPGVDHHERRDRRRDQHNSNSDAHVLRLLVSARSAYARVITRPVGAPPGHRRTIGYRAGCDQREPRCPDNRGRRLRPEYRDHPARRR